MPMTPTKIIVGTDFSEQADLALEHAMEVARHTGASLTLMHALNLAVDSYTVPFATPIPDVYLNQVKEIQMDARAKLEKTRERYAGQGVELSHVFVDQLAGQGIVSIAKESGADLIVVGSHGHGWFKGLLLGSVSHRVAKHSDMDVLVARGPAPKNGCYRKILVPTDFTEIGEHVLQQAIDLCEPDGTIELLHAWQLPGGPATYWGSVGPGFRESLQTSAKEFGDKAIKAHADAKVKLKFTQVEGEARRSIKDAVEKGGYDLVMMGTHSRKGLDRLLLGSVAESMVRALDVSVYLVRGH